MLLYYFWLNVVIIFTINYGNTYGANILAVFPCDSKSHYDMGKVIFEQLTENGHKITVINRFVDESHSNENITYIHLDGVNEHLMDIGLAEENYLAISEKSIIERLTNLIYSTTAVVNYTLGYPKVQKLISDSTVKFDLMIIDMYFMDSLLGLAHLWKIPAIVLCSVGTNKWTNEMVGNPHSPSYNPSIFLGYTDNMSFKERLYNALASAFEKITYNHMYLTSQEAIYKRYFQQIYQQKNEILPPLIDLIHNVSLVMLNSHPFLQYPRPYVPNMIQIGGVHMKRNYNELPQEINDYINIVPDGVVVMSFGNLIKTEDLPMDKLKAFLNAFKSYTGRLRVIMKYEGAMIEDQPDNMAIGPYLPLHELLDHPKVRIFITNGGSFSILEAMATGTPILGIPIYGDQDFNLAQIEHYGLGKILNYNNITMESIRYCINELLENPKYEENAKKYQKLFHDNPIDPLANAIYHIEYVLRTNGAAHLRSMAVDLSFWKQNLIDVSFVIILGIFLVLAIPAMIICVILRKNDAGKNYNYNNGNNNSGHNRNIAITNKNKLNTPTTTTTTITSIAATSLINNKKKKK